MNKKHEPIRVYIADVQPLADPLKYQAAYEEVSEARKRKAAGFRFPADKRLSLGAGLLLKNALEKEGIWDREIEVMSGGKPYLKNTKEWFFNLSHSGTKVLCVLAREPVGCDIEKKEKPPLELATEIFSRQEQERLLSLEEEAQEQYFYTLWTGKESYLKMTGEGLRHMPDDFTISVPFTSQIIRNRWVTFYDIPCRDGYQATICKEELIMQDMQETAFEEEIYLQNTPRAVHAEKLLVEYIEF